MSVHRSCHLHEAAKFKSKLLYLFPEVTFCQLFNYCNDGCILLEICFTETLAGVRVLNNCWYLKGSGLFGWNLLFQKLK